ncbi:MAG: hypothetical protein NZ941_02785, partial [Candidatus Caldarchaeum sp.]|nr:hypothetical protein [Candidatus Caldarchaeum sp.]
MTGFLTLATYEEALSSLFSKVVVNEPEAEKLSLEESLGRICAADVLSPVNVPPFDRSAVDGYAVKAADTFGASPTNPIT